MQEVDTQSNELQDINIDEEFKHLMPALDRKTFEALEANILENGCRDALVLWEGVLIDGYNRFEICTKHNVPFNTVSLELNSREEVLIWIINTQLGRRTLTPMQLTHFRGLHYRMEKKLKSNESGKNQFSEVVSQNETQPNKVNTGINLADQYRVSRNTILRDARASEALDAIGEVSPEAKCLILSGDVRIDKRALEMLASAPKEQIAEIAKHIESGTYEKGMSSVAAGLSAAGDAGLGGLAAGLSSPADVLDQEDAIGSAVDLMTGSAYKLLLNVLTGSEVIQAKKKALRSFIDRLEDMYSRL